MENEVELSFKVKRIIKSQAIADNIYVYRDEVYIGKNLYSTKEGIAESEDFHVKNLDCIKPKKHYFLLKKEYLGLWHTDILAMEHFKNYTTDHPYSDYLKGTDTYVPVLYDPYYETLSSLSGVLYPKAKFFDHTTAFIDNFEFDLDGLEEFLEKHPDRFCKVNRCPIPFYNADEYRTEQIAFIWVPTVKEYTKYISKASKTNGLMEQVAITIMGLDQFRIPHEND